MNLNVKLDVIGVVNDESGRIYLQNLQKIVNDRKLNRWVTLHVHTKQNNDEIRKILDNSDLRLHSTVLEGRGVALFESIISGSPVIAFRSGGIPETIVDEVNGLLVSPYTSKAMASTIFRYISDERLRLKMSSLCSLSAIQTYSQDHMYNKISKLLQLF